MRVGAPRESAMIGETIRGPKAGVGSPLRSAIIYDCPQGLPAMEAERVNQISASLADLKQRTAELRRYL